MEEAVDLTECKDTLKPHSLDGFTAALRLGADRPVGQLMTASEGVDLPTKELEKIIHENTGQEVRTVVLAYLQKGRFSISKR